MNIETILNRRERILRGIYPALEFVVLEDCTMGELVNRLDYDRFHTIYILNKDLDIMGKITETDIISVADKCSTKDRIGDVFKSKLR